VINADDAHSACVDMAVEAVVEGLEEAAEECFEPCGREFSQVGFYRRQRRAGDRRQ